MVPVKALSGSIGFKIEKTVLFFFKRNVIFYIEEEFLMLQSRHIGSIFPEHDLRIPFYSHEKMKMARHLYLNTMCTRIPDGGVSLLFSLAYFFRFFLFANLRNFYCYYCVEP